jgi:hypothetical protein
MDSDVEAEAADDGDDVPIAEGGAASGKPRGDRPPARAAATAAKTMAQTMAGLKGALRACTVAERAWNTSSGGRALTTCIVSFFPLPIIAALFPNADDAEAVEVVASDLFHLQARACLPACARACVCMDGHVC